jgi:hypothetical protein
VANCSTRDNDSDMNISSSQLGGEIPISHAFSKLNRETALARTESWLA